MFALSLPLRAQVPPPAARPVNFSKDIKPILQVACVRCHARGNDKGGFSIETRESLLKGGDTRPAVVPGRSDDSFLIALVSGLEPDMVMPKKGSRLTGDQIALLRAWIDQGAPWDPGVTFARSAPRNLARRAPPLPARPEASPVDRLLGAYFASHETAPAPRVDDRLLIRRLSLDVVGELPSPADVRAFVADRASDKRERLVARLLADQRRYAEHWLSFWNDLLRNDYRGTGYIDGGRRQITAWLYAALANNLPYDRFVASLVNPVPGTEGFTKGIVWRGVVNASQTPEMQAAQNVSQVFMGVNLKCASCHDSFINEWQLADAYGLASIYAEQPLEMVECDRPTGKTAAMKFLYAELGSIDPASPRGVRLDQLMHALVGPSNGRLARTIVNRLWARFMGHGLVEPVDDMEQAAWHPDLLDWLAEDLVDTRLRPEAHDECHPDVQRVPTRRGQPAGRQRAVRISRPRGQTPHRRAVRRRRQYRHRCLAKGSGRASQRRARPSARRAAARADTRGACRSQPAHAGAGAPQPRAGRDDSSGRGDDAPDSRVAERPDAGGPPASRSRDDGWPVGRSPALSSTTCSTARSAASRRRPSGGWPSTRWALGPTRTSSRIYSGAS